MKNGSVIAFHSNFKLRHAITKPLHYLIQWGTGSKFHHVGIYCDGYFYEAIGKDGVKKIKFKQKQDEIDACVDIHVFAPEKTLKKDEVERMVIDLDSQLGKKYSILEALGSVLTAVIFFDRDEVKTKKQFCSKLVFYAYRNIYTNKLNHILPRTINPEELLKILKRFKLIKEIGEVINGSA